MQRPTLVKIVYDMDYVESLKEDGNRGIRKAMAFFVYLHNLEVGQHEAVRYYANVWSVSTATAWAWLKEFDSVID